MTQDSITLIILTSVAGTVLSHLLMNRAGIRAARFHGGGNKTGVKALRLEPTPVPTDPIGRTQALQHPLTADATFPGSGQ